MSIDLSAAGIYHVRNLYRNLAAPALYEHAIRRGEGKLSHLGPLVTRTGQYTGRSPNDKFTVRDAETEEKVWWGKVNVGCSAEMFDALQRGISAYLQGRDVFVQDCYVGTAEKYRMPIRIITENAWHSLFARNMFVREHDAERLAEFHPSFTVLQAPGFHANPKAHGTNSEAFILINFTKRMVIIGGTQYGGEIKKSIFTAMNYLLPQMGVLGMHCSANIGKSGDAAIFFGLSGTGKTTLSADPNRFLIGDDEHGWSDDGIFNFEGGCYAKVIRLSEEAEPEIFACTRRFGTILENVVMDESTRRLDLFSAEYTENTRASYPITHLPAIVPSGAGDHPKNIIMLTADAFGVLPPIARMTPAQAMYHFISGYTAKVAGTERGIKEPQATFSTCFGSPFMALHPTVYARLLGERIQKHNVNCWLVNTGWTGGPYGTGKRMPIAHTRAMLSAALDGRLESIETKPHPVFGVHIPVSCPQVPSEVLDPRNTWDDPDAYDQKARALAKMFAQNFETFAAEASEEVRAAGPNAG